MSDAAAREAYDFLIGLISSTKGLEWVAEQVQEEVALGVLAQERFPVEEETYYEPDLERSIPLAPRSFSKAAFLTREEYTSNQRFELIANAVETVVIGGGRIQDELVRVLSIERPSVVVAFVPGETGAIQHTYDSQQLPSLKQVDLELQKEITALREDIANAD